MHLTPRMKIVISLGSLGLLGLITALRGADLATSARVLLGLSAAGGLAVWFWRMRSSAGSTSFRHTPRLVVVQRVGLSPRSGLALVEVDGRPFIVVHGDGFARLRPAPRPERVRHPRPLLVPPVAREEFPQ